jgi:hypothetical protein
MPRHTTRREFLNRFVGGTAVACAWPSALAGGLFGADTFAPGGVPALTTISGRPRERGLAYGAHFRDGIGRFLDREIYGAFLGKPANRREMLDYAAACARVVQANCPIVFEEVGGVAAGAGVLPEEIVLLSLHEELYHRGPLPGTAAPGRTASSTGKPHTGHGHCTAVAVGPPQTVDGATYVGQTWDWMQSVCGLSAVVEWRRDEGPSVLAYGFPGLWTGAGMNSAGVALCWTSANLERKGLSLRVGVPSYLLIAHLLYQDSLYAALEQARLDRHAGWFTFVMGDGAGRLASVEGSPTGVAVEELTGQLVRVGYGTRQMTATAERDNVPRHPRCQKMSDHVDGASGTIDQRWLQGTFEDPACEISVGKSTIDMLTFDTTRKVACLSRGPAYGTAWREFRFSNAPPTVDVP